jgi:hypothetical protein
MMLLSTAVSQPTNSQQIVFFPGFGPRSAASYLCRRRQRQMVVVLDALQHA